MNIEQFIEKYENLLDSKPLDTKALCQAILSDLKDVYRYDFTQLLLESNVDPLKWLQVQYNDVKCFNKDYSVFNFDDYLIENAFIELDKDFYSKYGMFSLVTVLDENKINLNLRSNKYTMLPKAFEGTKFESGCISIHRDDSSYPPCIIALRLRADNQTVYELERVISPDDLRYIPGIGFGLNINNLKQDLADLNNELTGFIKASLTA